jgi:hypothetical protein
MKAPAIVYLTIEDTHRRGTMEILLAENLIQHQVEIQLRRNPASFFLWQPKHRSLSNVSAAM